MVVWNTVSTQHRQIETSQINLQKLFNTEYKSTLTGATTIERDPNFTNLTRKITAAHTLRQPNTQSSSLVQKQASFKSSMPKPFRSFIIRAHPRSLFRTIGATWAWLRTSSCTCFSRMLIALQCSHLRFCLNLRCRVSNKAKTLWWNEFWTS